MWVYLWTKNAYIPNTNTVAYRPLTSTTTVNDQSWNSKNMTLSWTVTFGDYNWIDCAYFNGGYLYINESLILGANPRTISCWFNRENTPSQWGAFWGMGNASSKNWITAYLHTDPAILWHYGYWNRQYDWWFTQIPTVWTRYLLTFTYTWTNIWVYLNGTYLWTPAYWSVLTTATTLNLTSWKTVIAQMPHFWAPVRKWHITEFIVENKTWTAQEVTDYYNKTKSTYWL